MRRLTQAQIDSDNGRIYGRAPIPGARFEVNGVFYDSDGYECTLPGQKPREPEKPKEVEKPLTETEIKIKQFKEYLKGYTKDEEKADLIAWAKDNLDRSFHPNTGLAKLKDNVLELFIERVKAEEAEEQEAA